MPTLSPLAGKASVGMSGKENEQGDGGLFGYYNAALRCSPTSASSAIGGPRRGGGGFSALLGEARNEVLVERQINTMKADARVARELSHKERVAREQTLKEQHEKDEAAAQAVAKFYEEDERRQAHDVKVAARMLNEEKRQLQADAAVRKAREAEDAEHARRANEEEEINRQQWLKERDEEGAVVAKRVVQEVDDELLAERLIEQEKKDLAAARKAREAEDAEYARQADDKEEINRQRWLKERDEEGAEAAVQLAKVIDDELAAEEAAAKAKAEAEKLAAQEAEDAKEAGRLIAAEVKALMDEKRRQRDLEEADARSAAQLQREETKQAELEIYKRESEDRRYAYKLLKNQQREAHRREKKNTALTEAYLERLKAGDIQDENRGSKGRAGAFVDEEKEADGFDCEEEKEADRCEEKEQEGTDEEVALERSDAMRVMREVKRWADPKIDVDDVRGGICISVGPIPNVVDLSVKVKNDHKVIIVQAKRAAFTPYERAAFFNTCARDDGVSAALTPASEATATARSSSSSSSSSNSYSAKSIVSAMARRASASLPFASAKRIGFGGKQRSEEDKLKRLTARVLDGASRGVCTYSANLRLDNNGMRVRKEDVNHEYSSEGSLLYIYIENVRMRRMATEPGGSAGAAASSSSSVLQSQTEQRTALRSYADALRSNFREHSSTHRSPNA